MARSLGALDLPSEVQNVLELISGRNGNIPSPRDVPESPTVISSPCDSSHFEAASGACDGPDLSGSPGIFGK